MVSIRDHREPRVRKVIPAALRRREGAHGFVRTKYMPEVCTDCLGKGVFENKVCQSCGGTGEAQ